jgi:hypothetical protein
MQTDQFNALGQLGLIYNDHGAVGIVEGYGIVI